MSQLLFVYGTLRSDGNSPWHERLITPNCRFVGKATTPGRLVDLGQYPGLLPATRRNQKVTGEVWELNNPAVLPALDEYEGCAPCVSPAETEYVRLRQKVSLQDGRMVRAWVYRYTGPLDHARHIASGDYLT